MDIANLPQPIQRAVIPALELAEIVWMKRLSVTKALHPIPPNQWAIYCLPAIRRALDRVAVGFRSAVEMALYIRAQSITQAWSIHRHTKTSEH